jgi:hypothetical protein
MSPTSILLSLLMACSGGDDDSTPAPVDADDDGFTVDEDCDDNDPQAAPGLEEVCDGIDNNCDKRVDEGLMVTYYADFDRDGYGDPEHPYARCMAGDGFVTNKDDCDDDDPDVGPCKD